MNGNPNLTCQASANSEDDLRLIEIALSEHKDEQGVENPVSLASTLYDPSAYQLDPQYKTYAINEKVENTQDTRKGVQSADEEKARSSSSSCSEEESLCCICLRKRSQLIVVNVLVNVSVEIPS